jgi:hypothetical protein
LTKDIVEQLESAQIYLQTNRLGNKGYFCSATKDGLVKQISDLAKEYVSRELISEKLVIRYSIETQMSYQLTNEGRVVPNGYYKDGTGWRGGTKEIDATHTAPYGIKIYAGIFTRQDWRYRGCSIKTTLTNHWGSSNLPHKIQDAPNLHWIANLTTISTKENFWGYSEMEVKEMPYTEQNAKFFVDLISALCLLNEKILPIIKDEQTLLSFIESNQRLLN